jgi:hypothetical protein
MWLILFTAPRAPMSTAGALGAYPSHLSRRGFFLCAYPLPLQVLCAYYRRRTRVPARPVNGLELPLVDQLLVKLESGRVRRCVGTKVPVRVVWERTRTELLLVRLRDESCAWLAVPRAARATSAALSGQWPNELLTIPTVCRTFANHAAI